MDLRQPHGRQLKRAPGRQPILAKRKAKMDDSPVVEIRLIVHLRRLTGKKLAGAIAINGKRLLELVPRALPINPENTEANRHSEQDGRILKS